MRNEALVYPANPVEAVTADDPAGYYRTLPDGGWFICPELACRVAASAGAVAEVLSHPECDVRPHDARVPAVLQGSVAGEVFAALVRMQDGTQHAQLKQAVNEALQSVDHEVLYQCVPEVIAVARLGMPQTGEQLTQFNYAVPIMVVAHGLGIAVHDWPEVVGEVLQFVRCIAPGGTSQEISLGMAAAEQLVDRVQRQMANPGVLLRQLQQSFQPYPELTEFGLIANAVGLLFQACEGCAGWIGLCLLEAGDDVVVERIPALMEQVVLHSPPIQNTRRFVARDTVIHGCPVAAGEQIVVLLGAAGKAGYAFGDGPHACPGQPWARAITQGALAYLFGGGLDRALLQRYQWRRSVNARVPEFG